MSRAQTNRNRASRATTNLSTQLHLTFITNREKNKGRVADGFLQQTGENNLNRHWSQDKLDYTSPFVRVITTCLPTLSRNSSSHGGRCKYGCYRTFISTHRLKTAVVRCVVLSTKLRTSSSNDSFSPSSNTGNKSGEPGV